MKTTQPIGGPFGREFSTFVILCGGMTARSRKTWKFCEQFLRFWKNHPSQIVAAARIAPIICQGQPPHLAHIFPDFIQIGSLSAELLPNA